jgi:hypothetical protein
VKTQTLANNGVRGFVHRGPRQLGIRRHYTFSA